MLFSRWCLDETVTHFIYKGRQNDNNKEYKSVKERGIHIVSEHWLLEVWSLLCSFIKSEGKWRLKSSCMAVYFLFAFVLNMYRNWCFASCFEFINWAISFQWCTFTLFSMRRKEILFLWTFLLHVSQNESHVFLLCKVLLLVVFLLYFSYV